MRGSFMSFRVGSLFVISSVPPDENDWRRPAHLTVRRGRGGTVAMLGIEGSGKSTHAAALRPWIEALGYRYSNVPFHKYLFVNSLARGLVRNFQPRGGRGDGNPMRPLLSLVDNLLMCVTTAFGAGFMGKVVVYDRYIWSTYIKYHALGYPVGPLSTFYLLLKPTLAIVLDVELSRSLEVINSRPKQIRYLPEVLAEEREEYLRIARANGYPIIDAMRSFEEVQDDIRRVLARRFPRIK